MAVRLRTSAQLIERLVAIDLREPRLDVLRAERALRAHYYALGLPCPPVVWLDDPVDVPTSSYRPLGDGRWLRRYAQVRSRETGRWRFARTSSEPARPHVPGGPRSSV
jgi:hypothetical protein